jgi:glucosyl-dolichyl phosphate glucuronosyltransferase
MINGRNLTPKRVANLNASSEATMQHDMTSVSGRQEDDSAQTDSEKPVKWVSRELRNPLASIVVTSYTSSRLPDLADLIISVKRQDDLNLLEVVVVIEKEMELFEQVTSLLSSMQELASVVLYYAHLQGMSDARNRGCLACSGRFVAFVDDDVVLDDGWLRAAIKVMTYSDAIALTGPSHPIWTDPPLNWIPKELSWIIGSTQWTNYRGITKIRNVWGNNMVVRKKEFLRIHGFSNKYGLHNASRRRWFDPPSEDVDLSIRLTNMFHKPILYVPDLSVGHKVSRRRLSWRFIVQRSYSIGYQRYAIKKLYRYDPKKDPLNTEKSMIPYLLNLWPKSVMLFFKDPKKSLNVITTLSLVICFSLIGYLDRRPY